MSIFTAPDFPKDVLRLRDRHRLGLGLGTLVSVLLMANDSTQGAGLILCGLTIVLSLLFSAWLTKRSGQGARFLVDGGVHPSLGLLTYVAVIPWQIAIRVLIYAVAGSFAGWLMVSEGPRAGRPVEHAFAAAFLVTIPGWLMVELVSSLVVRRWGASPPRHVVLGYLVVGAGLMLLSGALMARVCISYIEVRFPGLWVDWLMWVPVMWVLSLVAVTWARDIVVTKWQSKIDSQKDALLEAERGRKLAEAQLAMLQAQIEPHFLYNTLASVQYLVRKDAASADFLLTHLIRYLRHAMPKMRQSLSTLEQEFELADAFLQIARMRMGGRLSVKVELEQGLHSIPFPPLVLQTVVENALKHGVEPKLGPVEITVRAELQPDTGSGSQLILEVIDNGAGLGKANTAGSGSGLANIRERLAGIYGAGASLVVSDALGGGVVSRVMLVLQDVPVELPSSESSVAAAPGPVQMNAAA